MKTKFILFTLLLCNILCYGQELSKYPDCYLGLVVKIQNNRDLYTKFNYKNKKLSDKIKDAEAAQLFIDHEFIVKEIITDVHMEKKQGLFLDDLHFKGSVVVLESIIDKTIVYYYAKFDKLGNGLAWHGGELTFYEMPEIVCEQYEVDYLEEQKKEITRREDIFTGTSALYSGNLKLSMGKEEFIFALKSKKEDSIIYALTFRLANSDLQGVKQGCYVVFEDNSRYVAKDAEVSIDYNSYSTYTPYSYTATIYLLPTEFKQFCDKRIKAVRVGSVSRERISKDYNNVIKYRFQALYESLCE